MRRLASIARRNRSILTLFMAMMVAPAIIFGILITRAVRSERLRLEFEKTQRQQQIVRLVEADLRNWLFASGGEAGSARALLRFDIIGESIRFPDFGLTLAASDAAERRPFESSPASLLPTTATVTEQYYPRIQAFLRDFRAGRHTGAQYFLRLKALVVRAPGQTSGYVIGVEPVVEHVNQRLAEFAAGEPFTATVWIADAPQQSAPSPAAVGMQGFPFFYVGFADTVTEGWADVGRGFPYSIGLLVVIAFAGSAFVYRVVAQEMRLAEMRSDFVAAVSHEFRSPLSSILALVERLQAARIRDPERLAEYHEIIGRDARRLGALVGRLLEFGQIEHGHRQYVLERVDLGGIVAEAVETCETVVGAGRIRFERGPQPLWMRGDAAAVRQAVQNLVENAAKYSPADSPIIVSCSSDAARHLVDVQDSGIGIPAAEHVRIFEKFYRGRQAVAQHVQGVGIGLALVRHVMDGHGGTVTVSSVPGTGSTFRLAFPAARPA